MAVVLAGALGGAATYVVTSGMVDLDHLGQPRNVAEIGGETVPLPTPADHPVRLAPAITTDASGEFAFLSEGADGPILHDPCRPIHWRLSTVNMPVGAEEPVTAAVASIAEHTGLVWIYDGYTGADASFDDPLLVRGETWDYAPVVIGWAGEGDQIDLEGDTTGVGGPRISPGAFGDQEFLRSGAVIIDTADLPDVLDRDEDALRTQAVVMHELGHVVGLGHVSDSSQLMFPATTAVAAWGQGDLAGLAAVGAGQCEGA